MCGLAGLWDIRGRFDVQTAAQVTRRMADAIRHRGPDDAGIYQDSDAGLVLGHRRLSIVDLSPLGHQPMVSSDGRYVIVFNGEVFNHHRLRPELSAAGA